MTAVVTGAVFTSVLPIAGKDLFAAHEVPVLLARVMGDTFGLAALALIDMVKAIDPAAVISDVRVEEKTGGKTGRWARP